MKLIQKIACLALVTTAAACGPTDGYYDSLGNYHHGQNGDAQYSTVQPGFSGSTYKGNNYYTDSSAVRGDSKRVTDYDKARDPSMAAYRRAGYYDYNGNYIPASADRPYVARSYFPPRGKCRVWYVERDYDDQPISETCVGIRDRAPDGTYIIYGGR
jgi:hypothetical protein